jgi:hypothetical protein
MTVLAITGATGIVTKGLEKNVEAVPGKYRIDSLLKTSILGKSHIIWEVLQCEAGSVSGGDHRWFKRSTGKERRVTCDIIIIIIIIIMRKKKNIMLIIALFDLIQLSFCPATHAKCLTFRRRASYI